MLQNAIRCSFFGTTISAVSRKEYKWNISFFVPDDLFQSNTLSSSPNTFQVEPSFLYLWYFSHYNGRYNTMKIIIVE